MYKLKNPKLKLINTIYIYIYIGKDYYRTQQEQVH